MAQALGKLGLAEAKSKRITLPNLYFVDSKFNSRELAFAWIRGYYDGDGHSGSTRISAANKPFLVRLKYLIGIENPINKLCGYYIEIDESGQLHTRKSHYTLSIGSAMFDEMNSLFERENLFYLKRKGRLGNQKSLILLEAKLALLGISKSDLKNLVYKYRQYELIEIFDTNAETFRALCKKLVISLPSKSYWTTYYWSGKLLKKK